MRFESNKIYCRFKNNIAKKIDLYTNLYKINF